MHFLVVLRLDHVACCRETSQTSPRYFRNSTGGQSCASPSRSDYRRSRRQTAFSLQSKLHTLRQSPLVSSHKQIRERLCRPPFQTASGTLSTAKVSYFDVRFDVWCQSYAQHRNGYPCRPLFGRVFGTLGTSMASQRSKTPPALARRSHCMSCCLRGCQDLQESYNSADIHGTYIHDLDSKRLFSALTPPTPDPGHSQCMDCCHLWSTDDLSNLLHC